LTYLAWHSILEAYVLQKVKINKAFIATKELNFVLIIEIPI